MKNVNVLSVLMICLLCTGFTRDEAWVVDSTSKLAIHGKTNINSFTCAMDSYPGFDTLHYFSDAGGHGLRFAKNRMAIPVRKFDCGAKQISRDFRSTLKSAIHPHLEISFVSLEPTLKDETVVNGIVDITLAGVTARYQIRFRMHTENETTRLTGTHPVNFADFNLTAPEKLNGLIRVKDVLAVEFYLVLKAVS